MWKRGKLHYIGRLCFPGMIGYPVIKIHNFITDLVQRCKSPRELAFVLETLTNVLVTGWS